MTCAWEFWLVLGRQQVRREGGDQGGRKGLPKGRLREPTPSSAGFAVLPRAVPVSSAALGPRAWDYALCTHSFRCLGKHCRAPASMTPQRTLLGSPALGSLLPGDRQRAGETHRCHAARPSAKLLPWGNWVTRSCRAANIPRGWASAPSGPWTGGSSPRLQREG